MNVFIKLFLKEKDNILFNGLIFYYWLVFSFINYQNNPNDADAYNGTGLRFLILVIPLIVYVAINAKVFLKIKFEKKIMWLIIYAIIVSGLSLIRLDFKTVINIGALVLPLIIITTIKPAMNLKMINILFLISIVIVIFLHKNGVSQYGYLPGQTIGNLNEGLWWRISIWEYCTPPFSAVFALIILIANFFYNPGRSRYLFYILGLYFIIFSGSRTALIVIFAGCIFLLSTRVKIFKPRLFIKAFPALCFVLYYLLLLFPIIIMFISIDNEFINSFLFRQAEGYEELEEQIARPKLISTQLAIFLDNSALGVGTKSLNEQYKLLTHGTAAEGTVGSDTFITYLLARDGLALIFLILFFASLFSEATKKNDFVMYLMLLTIMIYATSYGGFLNFMSPMFLMMWGLVYSGNNRQLTDRQGATCPKPV